MDSQNSTRAGANPSPAEGPPLCVGFLADTELETASPS